METVLILASIGGALLVGVMSPGPSFVVVARTSVVVSRRDGLAVALGMGTGGVIFGSLVLFGLSALLTHMEWLYVSLKIAGGCYLVYLAVRMWRGARTPLAGPDEGGSAAGSFRRSYRLGLTTQLSNPKTAVYYGSILAALVPADPSLWLAVGMLPVVVIVETGWYSVVALALSSSRPRAVYLRSKHIADRVTAMVLGALGLRLIIGAAR